MQPTLKQITHYFRTTLGEELLSFADYENSNSIVLNYEELKHGKVTTKGINKLAPREKKDAPYFDIVIAPMCLQRLSLQKGTTISPETIVPLLMPCSFDKTTQYLSAPKKLFPWFIRENLTPLASDDSFTLGQIDEARDILAKGKQAFHNLQWENYFAYTINALNALLKLDNHGRKIIHGVEYTASYKPTAYYYDNKERATHSIRNAYDRLKEQSFPALFQSFVTGREDTRPQLDIAAEAKQSIEKHTAQMNNSFGLGNSQRQTIHHYFACDNEEVLAVNGPPGTGKTTLLQSAIASEWVNAILKQPCGETIPPIIVATSSNNQAVTNVIRDFATILKKDSPNILERRWLPGDINSLGTYYASSSANNSNNYLTATHKWNGKVTALEGFFSKLESDEYTLKAYDSFQKAYETYSNEKLSGDCPLKNLQAIQKALYKQLQENTYNASSQIKNWLEAHLATQQCASMRSTLEKSLTQLNKDKIITTNFGADCKAVIENYLSHKKILQQAMLASSSEPFWFALATFFPFLKRKRKAYATAFTLKHDIKLSHSAENINDVCEHLTDQLNAISKLKEIAEQIEALDEIIDNSYQNFVSLGLSSEFVREDFYSLLTHLDTTVRYETFLFAIHYYEALWLEKTIIDLEEKRSNETSTRKKLQRVAMLTPCFVSTLFMAPKLMSQYGKPVFEGIDLLIFDEAGQASIDKAAIAFALAKKALVVGDVHQIEPVVSIPANADAGNIKRFKIFNEEGASLEHLAISQSNAMLLAQRATPYHLVLNGSLAKERGMHLLEHRRCPKTVINYCKELIYPNLEVLTVERATENFLYPQLGYINIPSFSERKNGSRFNTYEAANIAQWLADNREKILSHYQATNLSELVAIVTPFKLQASTLKKQLREKLPEADTKNIVVGTVHKMQGAEKKIVLFSPVYGMNDNTMRFIDQKLNMLNVAVSRAKDSFLVFGNLELFDAKSDQPSGILAKHLRFETGENELKDFQLIGRSIPATLEHLTTLEEHQKALTTCFNTAQRELIIVSPFITMNALKRDRIHETIAETTRRGVSVTIYADVSCVRFVNQNNEFATNQITELLKSTGARLHYGHGIHNKTIKVDDHTIIEGSFNWLSANRGSFAKLEHSIVYRGNEVKEFGKKIEDSLATIRTSY